MFRTTKVLGIEKTPHVGTNSQIINNHCIGISEDDEEKALRNKNRIELKFPLKRSIGEEKTTLFLSPGPPIAFMHLETYFVTKP